VLSTPNAQHFSLMMALMMARRNVQKS